MRDTPGYIQKWLSGEISDYHFEYLMSRIAEAIAVG